MRLPTVAAPQAGSKASVLLPDALDGWMDYEKRQRQLRDNTLRRLTYVRRGLQGHFGNVLLSDITYPEIQAFVDSYSARCRHFIDAGPVIKKPQCKKGLPGATCPMLTGNPQGCPKYDALTPATVSVFIGGIEVFYDYNVVRGLVDSNIVERVRKTHTASNRRRLTIQRNRLSGPPMELEHWRKLVDKTPIHNSMLYFLMGKYGLRPHEPVKLNLDPSCFSLGDLMMRIPEGGMSGDKRMGNRFLPIDWEAKVALDTWLPMRDRVLAGWQTKDLLISSRSKPYTHSTFTMSLARMFKRDCKRLKIAPKTGGQYVLKSFRRFFTKTLEENECPADWVRIFRGDTVPGAVADYWRPGSEMHEKFDKYGPKLRGDT